MQDALTIKQSRLPLTFDPGLLERDLQRAIATAPLVAHSGNYYSGEWSGIALQSSGGVPSSAPSRPSLEPYRATAALERAPYFQQVLETIACPKHLVRVLFLTPGSVIKDHFDFHVGFQAGLLRLHIPIVTHPDIVFMIGGERCRWQPGEFWYGDFNQTHSVANPTDVNRAHMVMDVEINDYLLGLFPPALVAAQRAVGISMAREAWPASTEVLARSECDFRIPRAALSNLRPLSHDMRAFPKESAGKIRLRDGHLVVLVDGVPTARLNPVGEERFGVQGWAPGVTLTTGPGEGAGEPRQVVLSIQGIQDDVVRARAGVRTGENQEKVIAMPAAPPG